MAVLIRAVEAGDVAGMAAIRARQWETFEYWNTRIARYLSGEHSPQQALPARTAFVAVEDQRIVGFAAGHLTRRYRCDAELEWIDVAAEQQRRGIAGELVMRMAGWFVEQEARRVCVNVEPNNAVARALYAKYGARRLNEYWMIWEDARQIGAAD